jgi:hypothetical protein
MSAWRMTGTGSRLTFVAGLLPLRFDCAALSLLCLEACFSNPVRGAVTGNWGLGWRDSYLPFSYSG